MEAYCSKRKREVAEVVEWSRGEALDEFAALTQQVATEQQVLLDEAQAALCADVFGLVRDYMGDISPVFTRAHGVLFPREESPVSSRVTAFMFRADGGAVVTFNHYPLLVIEPVSLIRGGYSVRHEKNSRTICRLIFCGRGLAGDVCRHLRRCVPGFYQWDLIELFLEFYRHATKVRLEKDREWARAERKQRTSPEERDALQLAQDPRNQIPASWVPDRLHPILCREPLPLVSIMMDKRGEIVYRLVRGWCDTYWCDQVPSLEESLQHKEEYCADCRGEGCENCYDSDSEEF